MKAEDGEAWVEIKSTRVKVINIKSHQERGNWRVLKILTEQWKCSERIDDEHKSSK